MCPDLVTPSFWPFTAAALHAHPYSSETLATLCEHLPDCSDLQEGS